MKPSPRFAGLFVLAGICWLPVAFAQAAPMAAIVANQTISFVGSAITVDSYDSTDPAKSSNGHYDSSKYSGDMGDIVANAGVLNALDVGNAKIYGRAHVGPGGTIILGPSGAIGEHSWQATNSGIEPSWFAADAHYTLPDVSFPYQASNPGVQTWTEPGNVVSTNISYATNFVTSTNFPNPLPWGGVVTTNISFSTITNFPDPPPAGLVTNTTYTTSRTVPEAGTYVGTVGTNYVSSGPPAGRGWWYTYYQITSYAFPVNYSYNFNLYVTNTVWTTNHYDNFLIAGASYFLSSLTGSTYVAGMDVRLVVANGINLAYPFTVPQGSAVKVWSGGNGLGLTSNQTFNQSGHAESLVIYCGASVTTLTVAGTVQFNGIIYAPSVDFLYNNGSLNSLDFCGALFVNSASLHGHVSFHFDEALIQGPAFPYLITVQPTNQTVLAGQNASFSISVADLGPYTYQWLFAQDTFAGPLVPIPGATNIVLTLTNVNKGNIAILFPTQFPSTKYVVVVSNSQGSVTSSVAILTVFFPPEITNQPLELILK